MNNTSAYRLGSLADVDVLVESSLGCEDILMAHSHVGKQLAGLLAMRLMGFGSAEDTGHTIQVATAQSGRVDGLREIAAVQQDRAGKPDVHFLPQSFVRSKSYDRTVSG